MMKMTMMTMVQAINSALKCEMKLDKTVVVLGEDVGVDGGVFRVTEGLLNEFGAERVIDTPLAESGFIGCTIGMAVNGLKPVAEVQFSGFIYPGFDQLISHAARIRNRSRGTFHCQMVLRTPYGGGIRALEHHMESTEAYFIHTPGLKVVIPSSPYDAKGLMISAIRDPDPVIFFESLKLYRAFKEDVPDEAYAIPLGQAKIAKEGTDVTLISYGAAMSPTLQAADEAASSLNVNAEVIDLRTLSPWDKEMVLESVKKTGRAIIVHEAPKTCGLGGEISASICEEIMLNLKAPVLRVAGPDVIPPLAKLENYYLPNSYKVLKEINKIMQF